MGICLKELRETQVWLTLHRRTSNASDLADLDAECDELTAIFVTSIKTARRGLTGRNP
jgi:four helix bundle protein